MTPDGSPVFWAGNIAVHIFDLGFLEQRGRFGRRVCRFTSPTKRSRISTRASGRQIEPDQPNALKFERFIFDLLPAAKRAIVYEVDARDGILRRSRTVRAKPPTRPKRSQRQMISLARRWLAEAGAQVDRGGAGRDQSRCSLRMRRNWPGGFRPDCM